ncbi:MAG: hypothetical protein ABWZ76_08975 [Acidimicrobiales bacterium]
MAPPLSERFERSALGRLLVSIGIVVVLLAEVGTHLPPSALERAVSDPAGRIVRVLASEQSWAVFAPNPRSTSLEMYAVVTFADGSTARWTVPDGARIGTNLRFYRWRKWLDRVRSDDHRAIWDPTARWIAELYDDRGSAVTRVELVRRFRDNAVSGPQPAWQEFTYFTLELGPAAGTGTT